MADSTRRKRVPNRKGQSKRVLHCNGPRFHAAWLKGKKG